MSYFGKPCSFCGEQKPIFCGWSNTSPEDERNYCEDCYYIQKGIVECGVCGKKVFREDLTRHESATHPNMSSGAVLDKDS